MFLIILIDMDFKSLEIAQIIEMQQRQRILFLVYSGRNRIIVFENVAKWARHDSLTNDTIQLGPIQ